MAVLEATLAGFSAERAVDLSNKPAQVRLSRAAVPAFFKLTDAWGLKDEAARQLLQARGGGGGGGRGGAGGHPISFPGSEL